MKRRCIIPIVLITLIGCVNSDRPIRLSDIDTSDVRLPDSLESVLSTSHTIELLSLNPESGKEIPGGGFHGWETLGRVQLDENAAIKVVDGLKAGVATAPNYAAACFNPRHGLRLSADEKTVDVVICFECVQIYVYENNERVDTLGTSDLPLKLFNEVVSENKLPMPPPAKP